jgi:hypothetical protein
MWFVRVVLSRCGRSAAKEAQGWRRQARRALISESFQLSSSHFFLLLPTLFFFFNSFVFLLPTFDVNMMRAALGTVRGVPARLGRRFGSKSTDDTKATNSVLD